MSDPALPNHWLKQLDDIIEAQTLSDDADIQRQRNLIEIEITGMQINLPTTEHEVREQLEQYHRSKVVSMMFDLLQNVLGYYALPEVKAGDNEPPIGPMIALDLKSRLVKNEVDLYFVKSALSEILQSEASE